MNKGYKAPIYSTNKDVFMKLFDDVEIYFRNLKEYKTGESMLRGGQKNRIPKIYHMHEELQIIIQRFM